MKVEQYKILVADDDIGYIKKRFFNLGQDEFQLYFINHFDKILATIQKVLPDVILINQQLFVEKGNAIISHLQKSMHLRNTPVVVIAAKADEATHIKALEASADDFIADTASYKFLHLRIKALLKRATTEHIKKQISFNDFTLDIDDYVLTSKDEIIRLPKREFELLSFFATNPNRVFSRKEIVEALVGKDIIISLNSVDVHICKIRQRTKINNIETIARVGYRFLI